MPEISAAFRGEQAREIADYYKWLHRWVRYSRGIRPVSGFDSHAVHRPLTDPATGESGPFVVHRLMLEGFDLPPEPHVLDAGCGYGGTAFDLYPKIRGNWLGITLSRVQKTRAQSEAVRRGLNLRLDFRVASYDDPLEQTFDLVIAIESLVHSANPPATIANLSSALVRGGYLVMVDDMPTETIPAEFESDLFSAKQFWRAPVMPTERGWRTAFETAGLDIVSARDLTPMTQRRVASEIDGLIARDRRRLRWLGWTGMRMIPEASIGGLLLERLAAANLVQYRVLTGRKRA